MIESINPATEQVLATFEELNPQRVEDAVASAHLAWRSWSQTTLPKRGHAMHRAASFLRENKPRYSRLISMEMGKPIVETPAEIEKCAWTCDFFADDVERFLSPQRVCPCLPASSRSVLIVFLVERC